MHLLADMLKLSPRISKQDDFPFSDVDPLVKKLVDPIQQKVLLACIALLVLVGIAFAVPAVNKVAIGIFWFLFKVSFLIYMMIWFRGTFPRFRYDQLMNIGWKIAIPVGMVSVMLNALIGMASPR